MKNRKITAVLCALMTAASLAACGNTDSGSTPTETIAETTTAKTTEKQTENETEAETEAPKETDAEETSEETTTAEPEPEADPRFDYYDVLSADYGTNGRDNIRFNMGGGVHALKENNTVYFQYEYRREDDGNVAYSYASFNTDTKEIKNDLAPEDVPEDLRVFRYAEYDQYYINYGNGNFKEKKMTNPRAYKTGNPGRYINGMYLTDHVEVNDKGYYFLVVQGDGEYYCYPQPSYEMELEHGLTETVDDSILDMFVYKDTIYGVGWNGIYTLDRDKKEWANVEFGNYDYPNYYILWNDLIVDAEKDIAPIYDMKTGETVAEVYNRYINDKLFYKSYMGGKSNIVLYDSAWRKVQFPSDGSEPDWSKAETLGSESSNYDISYGLYNEVAYGVFQIDDTYYTVTDQYGIFLRTYEKGEAEEETIMLFDN